MSRVEIVEKELKGASITWIMTGKIMKAYDSRAIANDMYQPPFTKLPLQDQISIRLMCGNEIMTLDQYLIERDKLVKKWDGKSEWEFPMGKPRVETKPFTDQIREFIQGVTWTYARTMPEWPHEYIVRYKVDKELFLEMVKHIREYGYRSFYYEQSLIYFNEDRKVYWTMSEPLDKTIVINRCREEDTYEARRKNGTLPEIKTT